VALGQLSYGKLIADVAAGAVVFVGVMAALNQLQIAPAIINGNFYGVVAVIVGTLVVALGGGGIAPMQRRWEQALGKLEAEAPKIKQARDGASERIKQRAQMWQEQAEDGRSEPSSAELSHRSR
jgi:hypothetical protein